MAAAGEAPPRMMKRLPQEEVYWILARDRVRTYGRPNFEALEDELEELQTWVRAEYGTKGFVEVDYHTFVSVRVLREKIWENEFGRLKAYRESRSRPL